MLAAHGEYRGCRERGRNKKLIAWVEFADTEASSRITLEDGRVLTRCDQCREMWIDRNARGIPGDPPCDTCWVDLLDTNRGAVDVFMLTRRQVVTADQGQIVDISIPAIKIAMDLYEIKNQKECLLKVRRLFHHFEQKRREDAD